MQFLGVLVAKNHIQTATLLAAVVLRARSFRSRGGAIEIIKTVRSTASDPSVQPG